MKHIVIVGTGLAGYMLAKEFRKLDTDTSLTLITRDDGCFYSKPLLSTALTQQKTPDQLPVCDVNEMRVQLDATIYTRCDVLRIDSQKKQLFFENEKHEQMLHYDKLVLANGASTIKIPLQGDAASDVLSVNTLEEYRHFRAALFGKKHIAILGSGLVGCEFANDLLNTGHMITVISIDDYPLKSFVPEAIGCALKETFMQAGVTWILSHAAIAVNHANGYVISLANGETIIADFVLSAVGIRPDLTLAKTAALKTDLGVMVNSQLQTSDRNIFALGDCATVNGQLKMYIAPLLHCAKILAQTLAENNAHVEYSVMPIVIKTPSCPMVVVPPEKTSEGQWIITGNQKNLQALFYNHKQKLQGFALSGDYVKNKMLFVKQMTAEK